VGQDWFGLQCYHLEWSGIQGVALYLKQYVLPVIVLHMDHQWFGLQCYLFGVAWLTVCSSIPEAICHAPHSPPYGPSVVWFTLPALCSGLVYSV
jgi:hypothetical protein